MSLTSKCCIMNLINCIFHILTLVNVSSMNVGMYQVLFLGLKLKLKLKIINYKNKYIYILNNNVVIFCNIFK